MGQPPSSYWHPFTRVAFRFWVLYLALFWFRFLSFFINVILGNYNDLKWLKWLYLWVGSNVFNTELQFFTGEISDTTYDYVIVATHLSLALIGALIWSVAGRRQLTYPRLYDLQWTVMRGFLSCALISYGISKIYAIQMATPSLSKLAMPLGNLTRMDLLWIFMGASTAYQMIAGWLEFIPGMLLLFRRTSLLGALMGAVVLLNVLLLNICYGVGIKLFSGHLVLMACVIALPDAARLFRFLLTQQAVEPRQFDSPWRSVWVKRFCSMGRMAWVGLILFWTFFAFPNQLGLLDAKNARPEAVSNPLEGNTPRGRTWDVVDFSAAGDEELTNAPWRMVTVKGDGTEWLILSVPSPGQDQQAWLLSPFGETGPENAIRQTRQLEVRSFTNATLGDLVRYMQESIGKSQLPEPMGTLECQIDGPVDNPKQAEFSGELRKGDQPVQFHCRLVQAKLQPEDFRLIRTPLRWVYEYADGTL